MEELKKVRRVIEKAVGRPPDEILLVLDATTGQNGIAQARAFTEAVEVTGVALTKLDGTAKGESSWRCATSSGCRSRSSAPARASGIWSPSTARRSRPASWEVDRGQGRDPDRRGPPDDARGDAVDPGERRVRYARGVRRQDGAVDGARAAAGHHVPRPQHPRDERRRRARRAQGRRGDPRHPRDHHHRDRRGGREYLLSLGADDYFPKPFPPTELLRTVERVLEGPPETSPAGS